MQFEVSKATLKDNKIIKKQLKSNYSNIYGVISRCSFGYPQAVILNSIKNEKTIEIDFTGLANTLWLCCPYLCQKIHDLEQKGFIKKIQNFIQKDRKMTTMMEDAHAHYYYFRKQMYYNLTGESYPEEYIKYFNRGIGGIYDPKYIKCLHLHYVHYLFYEGNLAGRITERLLDSDSCCPDELCKKLDV